LTKLNRTGWLDDIRAAMQEWTASKRTVVLACSALKGSNRKRNLIRSEVRFVHLKVCYDTLQQRLRSRQGHFANVRLLKSQLADLENPVEAITVDANRPVDQIVAEVCERVSFVFQVACRDNYHP
jgi:gluconokinase